MKLFEKGKIGNLEIKNRVFMTAMGTAYDSDGGFSERAINFYTERAKGGYGLITTGMCVSSTKYETPLVNVLNSVHHVDRLAQVADNVHHYGAKLSVQIGPGNGRNSPADPSKPPRSASAVSSFWFEDMKCIPFTVEEIQDLVKSVGYSAYLAKTAGADAVELHAYGGYLIDQFQTEMWNQRTDEYGGDLEGRMRFTMEIIEEIQKMCGKDFPLIIKFTPDHVSPTPGSRTLSEGIEMAKMFEKAGVAALHIDKGSYDSWYEVIPNVYVEDANQIDVVKEIKKVVNIPVMCQGKLGDPEVAESVLENGFADFIGQGHAGICEPHWVYKIQSGKAYDLRPCIGCNECVANIAIGKDSICSVNPIKGVEKRNPLTKVDSKKRLLVVGGGPAGMVAALTADYRGIEVELWEKSGKLGGLLNAAGAPSFKKDVEKYRQYLSNKLHRSNVDIKVYTEATVEKIKAGNFDFVILATGAMQNVPNIPGVDNDNVYSSTNVLLKKSEPGENNVVIGGGLVGCETALMIVRDFGKKATIIEMMDDILPSGEVFLNNEIKLREMLKTSEIDIICSANITSIGQSEIKYEIKGEEKTLKCDNVVLATGYRVDRQLEEALTANCIPFKAIGDCVRSRKIMDAVHEGYNASRILFEEVEFLHFVN